MCLLVETSEINQNNEFFWTFHLKVNKKFRSTTEETTETIINVCILIDKSCSTFPKTCVNKRLDWKAQPKQITQMFINAESFFALGKPKQKQNEIQNTWILSWLRVDPEYIFI